jgi:DNA processing protein
MEFQERTPQAALGPLNESEGKNAPAKLYCVGDESLLREGKRVSVVGARKASIEGLSYATKITRLLTKEGVIIVSGLAEGIDTSVHRSAIQNNGRTIAVIGTPIDKCYPSSNRALQEQISKEHLLVSQFSPGTATHRGNFPRRNKTMALLSEATIIAEAGEGSGSLHQGWEAIRLGRPLYIPEHLARNRDLSWPGKMLFYGAQVLDENNLSELIDSLPCLSRFEIERVRF